MAAHGDSCTIYLAKNDLNHNTRVVAWIERSAHWRGPGVVLERGNTPQHDSPFLRCREERSQIVCVVEFLAQYVNFFKLLAYRKLGPCETQKGLLSTACVQTLSLVCERDYLRPTVKNWRRLLLLYQLALC